ncbi:gp53-like domain-containing protein [Sphingomonas sp. 8AM]|uniref:gp53-like domain-containing protein n=1 Tax=Sphingomonas sp. 8AM TaxID=2653170 RepID=UPI0012F45C73|nr:hypothetical protein [Sphingomonas sp. 8AM]VXC79813.1 conserved hypothetical protein [Sphingomonas sp. 8AM]
MALQLVITNAGRAAVIDQANGGFRAVRIAAVGVSPAAVTATPDAASLSGEVKRIASIAGEATAADVVHLTVTDESGATYAVRSFALYLSDGTLFALYGQADTIVEKSAQALLLLAIDIALSNIPAAAITFGNANFTNPAATLARAGVIEIADDDEELAAVDRTKALTPKSLNRAIRRGVGGRPVDFDTNSGSMTIRGDQFGWETGYFFRGASGATVGGFGAIGGNNTLNYFYVGTGYQAANNLRVYPTRVSYGDNTIWHAGNDGAGSGLDADLLDGRHADAFALLAGGTFTGNISVAPSGSGQVSLAHSGTTGASGYVEFRRSDSTREGYIGFAPTGGQIQLMSENGRGFNVAGGPLTRAGNALWDAGNDGAGSGLDADLLDGHDAAEFALLTGARYTGLVRFQAQEAIRLAGKDSFISFYSADEQSRRGYLQFYGTSGVLANDGAGALHLQTGGTNVLTAGPGGVAITGGLSRNGNLVWDAGTDGAGSGLDADLLDGRHADAFLTRNVGARPLDYDAFGGSMTIRGDTGGWSTGYNFRAGDGTFLGGFGALGGGNSFTYYFVGPSYDAANGLRVYPNRVTYGDNTIWHAANDGAGSGLDADLLDGWQRDDVRDWNNLLNKPVAFPVAAHTHGAADIAGAFPGSLSGNGYTVLPNGLILQWVTGAQQAASSEGTQYVAFPIAFNTCFQVMTSTQVANPNIESHAVYQLISFTAEGATVMRQLVSASGADREPSWPRLFAIGR